MLLLIQDGHLSLFFQSPKATPDGKQKKNSKSNSEIDLYSLHCLCLPDVYKWLHSDPQYDEYQPVHACRMRSNHIRLSGPRITSTDRCTELIKWYHEPASSRHRFITAFLILNYSIAVYLLFDSCLFTILIIDRPSVLHSPHSVSTHHTISLVVLGICVRSTFYDVFCLVFFLLPRDSESAPKWNRHNSSTYSRWADG